jgi:hypothetical protein
MRLFVCIAMIAMLAVEGGSQTDLPARDGSRTYEREILTITFGGKDTDAQHARAREFLWNAWRTRQEATLVLTGPTANEGEFSQEYELTAAKDGWMEITWRSERNIVVKRWLDYEDPDDPASPLVIDMRTEPQYDLELIDEMYRIKPVLEENGAEIRIDDDIALSGDSFVLVFLYRGKRCGSF